MSAMFHADTRRGWLTDGGVHVFRYTKESDKDVLVDVVLGLFGFCQIVS